MSDPVMGDVAAQDSYDPFAAEQFVNPAVQSAIGSLATLPQRAIQNSQYALDTGTYDPRVPLEAATLLLGTGAIAGVPIRGGEMALGAGGIRAYHGSPHDFEKFDLSKIGTGEGAQAYGHGLYFAENPSVAESYKTSVTRNIDQLQDIARQHGLTGDAADMLAHQFSTGFGGTRFDDWIDGLRSAVDDPLLSPRVKAAATQLVDKSVEAADAFTRMKAPGKMYEVNINADPAHMLDWDKLPREQTPQVRNAINAVMRPIAADYAVHPDLGSRSVASVMYDMAHPKLTGSHAQASAALNEAGVPGIRYLDQGSRAGIPNMQTMLARVKAEDELAATTDPARRAVLQAQLAAHDAALRPTSNYVIFNPGIVDIMRKYGIAGAAPAGLGALAAQDSYQQGD